MPVYSMTGFATGTLTRNSVEISCEIRALNSRYLEIFAKLPGPFREEEDRVKDLVRRKVERAKINVSVVIAAGGDVFQSLSINHDALQLYVNLLQELRTAAGITEPVSVADILQFKDVLTIDQYGAIDDEMRQSLYDVLNQTLDALNATRLQEGENLKSDLVKRLGNLHGLTEEIAGKAKSNAQEEFARLHERLLANIAENQIDRNRLEMELALISDRVDISEEVVRMRSHLELFAETLEGAPPVGKKLNFILQEMHREANTMSTKSTRIDVSHLIVTVKEEIERMREQVQNVE